MVGRKDGNQIYASEKPSGPLASGVPGFVAGTWELKQRLGNPAVSWEQLIQPSVDMCFEGITVNNHAYHMMHQVLTKIKEASITSTTIRRGSE